MTILEMLQEQGLLVAEIDPYTLDFTVKKDPNRSQAYVFDDLEHDYDDKHGYQGYQVTIEKVGSKWVFYAEEHEPDDLDYDNYLPTLKAIKEQAFEFARFYQACKWQNMRDNDPEA
jgi:hypothetical protein